MAKRYGDVPDLPALPFSDIPATELSGTILNMRSMARRAEAGRVERVDKILSEMGHIGSSQ